MNSLKRSVRLALESSFNVSITRRGDFESVFEELIRLRRDLEFLRAMPKEQTGEILNQLGESKSQIRQDLFVLSHLDFKRNGYFVEFGATNGIDISNTCLLERNYDWSGILAEPARCWHDALGRNRKAVIERRCVWKTSGAQLSFNEVDSAELSTIEAYSDGDLHRKARQRGRTYEVETISLDDLLDLHGAPRRIDYLSIDTEGSEFEILENLDFSRWSFEVITCEHNHTPMREKIFDLLSRHGYRRTFEALSDFDDWYVRAAPSR